MVVYKLVQTIKGVSARKFRKEKYFRKQKKAMGQSAMVTKLVLAEAVMEHQYQLSNNISKIHKDRFEKPNGLDIFKFTHLKEGVLDFLEKKK